MPVVRTDGRAYGHVITKFSRMGRLPHFLTHGAPQARFARQSSANIALSLYSVFPRPSRSMHFGDVSEANARLLRSDYVTRNALTARNNKVLGLGNA